MTPEFATGIFIESLKTAMLVAAPCLVFGLVAGVLISMFQAVTQINEMTLVFIPKMLAVGVAVIIFFPWMLQVILDFSQGIFSNLSVFVR